MSQSEYPWNFLFSSFEETPPDLSSVPLAQRTYVPNRRIACTPFETLALEAQGTAFKTVKEKNDLFKLKVLIGNERYRPGLVVYVRGDIKTMPWTREVFTIKDEHLQADVKFILVPEDYIQLVERTA